MMKQALGIVCGLTMLATVYLTVSLLVLQPPRANVWQWWPGAALILTQGALTWVALTAGWAAMLRPVVLAGGAAVALFGAWWVERMMSGPHFEGYAAVLGSMLVVQGALTFVSWCQTPDKS